MNCFSCDRNAIEESFCSKPQPVGLFDMTTETMFTLYGIGFCSVSKVAPVQCEQELMFCCDAEIVPTRSQCEQEPYPSYNLQHSLLI